MPKEVPDPSALKVQCEVPVHIYLKELCAKQSADDRAALREWFASWAHRRATVASVTVGSIALVVAVLVLLLGNQTINGIVRDRIEAKLAELEKAKIDALVAAGKAVASSQDADAVATRALHRSEDVDEIANAKCAAIDERHAKLNSTVGEVEEKVTHWSSTIRQAMNAAIEAAVAQVTAGADEKFAANSRVPVYLWSNDEAEAYDVIRQVSQRGFRVSRYRGFGELNGSVIVYACGWRDRDESKERRKLYEQAAHDLGLPFPIRQESDAECDMGSFPAGVTIVIRGVPRK